MSTAVITEPEAPEAPEQDYYTATYSPQDNKLRLYTSSPSIYLDPEIYKEARKLGFIRAPKQGFFVALKWTPAREDWLLKLAGYIEDEDSTTEERAADRAARFRYYSEKRGNEAESALAAVQDLTANLPLGQKIIVGRATARAALKKADKITCEMRRVVNLWETSEYWTRRARASLAHARYAEKPAVRYQRIKRIEAEKRSSERSRDGQKKALAVWSDPALTYEKALAFTNIQTGFYGYISLCFPLDKYPRDHDTYEGSRGIWDALNCHIINEEQAAALMVPYLKKGIAWHERWIAHYENRLTYELAMLGEDSGPSANVLAFQKMDMQPGGTIRTNRIHSRGDILSILRVNRKDGAIISVKVQSRYGRYSVPIEEVTDYTPPTEERAAAAKNATKKPSLVNYPGEGFKRMTKEEWSNIHNDYKGIETVKATAEHGAYRYRKAMYREDGRTTLGPVFLTDLKETPIPAPTPEEDKPDLTILLPQRAE